MCWFRKAGNELNLESYESLPKSLIAFPLLFRICYDCVLPILLITQQTVSQVLSAMNLLSSFEHATLLPALTFIPIGGYKNGTGSQSLSGSHSRFWYSPVKSLPPPRPCSDMETNRIRSFLGTPPPAQWMLSCYWPGGGPSPW